MQRKMIGDPKTGLALHIEQTPEAMTLAGRPDPLLLIVVLAALVCVGIIGAVAASPREGVLSFVIFAFLFLPLICVLAFNAVRIRTLCVLDLARGELRIDEQSYTRRVREVYPLDDVASVIVRRLPATPLTGDATTYGLFLGLQSADYLAGAGTNEQIIGQDAWRISRFLGVPLETPAEDAPARTRTRLGILLTAALLYLLPIVVAISALAFLFEQLPRLEPSLVGLLGAVVISQIGAILAYAYYRARRPYES
jgi:hypothetical protein